MRHLALLVLAITLLVPVSAQAYCKLALAFALDVSSSVNDGEYRIQLHGLADALASDEVQNAILSPEGAHIMAAAYEWSGYPQQTLLLDWTKLDTPGAISLFANKLRQTRRRYAEFPTALGKAVEFGAHLLHRAPPCSRQVLDISGDGHRGQGRFRPVRQDRGPRALAARRRFSLRHDAPLVPARGPRRRRRFAGLLPPSRAPRQGAGPDGVRCLDARRRLRSQSGRAKEGGFFFGVVVQGRGEQGR
ncbi:MAG: DUF1194 domain-containing protein, partial [Pseudomonadota bacterium]